MTTARSRSVLAAAATAFGLSLLGTSPVQAADHNDSPLVKSASRSYKDITDVFVFRTPENPDRLTIVTGHFSPEVAATLQQFGTDAVYETYIDTNGDFVADHTITSRFGAPDANGVQSYEVEGIPGNSVVRGTTTTNAGEPSVAASGSARVFCGLADDPFKFDLDAFNAFVKAPCVPAAGLRCPGTGAPTNFFAGRNIAAIAYDFPITAMSGITAANAGVIRIWSKAFEVTSE